MKYEFEMKDLGKTKNFPRSSDRTLIWRSFCSPVDLYWKVLKRFNMDKSHPMSSSMVVWSFDVKKDPFRLQKDNEEKLDPKIQYLDAIGALMYLLIA